MYWTNIDTPIRELLSATLHSAIYRGPHTFIVANNDSNMCRPGHRIHFPQTWNCAKSINFNVSGSTISTCGDGRVREREADLIKVAMDEKIQEEQNM